MFFMAQPQLQIERKVELLEKAILKVGESLLSEDEKEEVQRILRGEDKTYPTDSAPEPSVTDKLNEDDPTIQGSDG